MPLASSTSLEPYQLVMCVVDLIELASSVDFVAMLWGCFDDFVANLPAFGVVSVERFDDLLYSIEVVGVVAYWAERMVFQARARLSINWSCWREEGEIDCGFVGVVVGFEGNLVAVDFCIGFEAYLDFDLNRSSPDFDSKNSEIFVNFAFSTNFAGSEHLSSESGWSLNNDVQKLCCFQKLVIFHSATDSCFPSEYHS